MVNNNCKHDEKSVVSKMEITHDEEKIEDFIYKLSWQEMSECDVEELSKYVKQYAEHMVQQEKERIMTKI